MREDSWMRTSTFIEVDYDLDLLKNVCYCPLLVLKGIHHYALEIFFIFPGGFSKWKINMKHFEVRMVFWVYPASAPRHMAVAQKQVLQFNNGQRLKPA